MDVRVGLKESWALKNWCFWTVVLEKTPESPLGSKEIQQSILKEISPEYSLEGLMLKLKLQYFGHLMWRTDIGKDPDVGENWRQDKEGVTEESETVGLKLNIQKIKIMASGPITSWQIDGETVRDFIFLGYKITADGDCSMELRRLLLWSKAMTNLDSILKSRDITLLTKVHLVKAMVFPLVMYRYQNWIIKKAEHWRTGALELWCWRKLLRVPWTARKSNKSTVVSCLVVAAASGIPGDTRNTG